MLAESAEDFREQRGLSLRGEGVSYDEFELWGPWLDTEMIRLDSLAVACNDGQ